jgi:tetratricopeptide (TPR) repeat protein
LRELAEAGWVEVAQVPDRARFEAELPPSVSAAAARNGTWYFNQGLLFEHRGEDARALEMYRQALEVEADNAGALFNLSFLLTRLGFPAESLQHSEHVLRLDPQSGRAHLARADALWRLGRESEAEGSYRQALRHSPDLSKAAVDLGRLLVQRGAYDEAQPLLEKVLEGEPENHDARLGLAMLEEGRGRPEEAERELRALLARVPDSWLAQMTLGRVLAARGEGEEASRWLDAAAASVEVADPVQGRFLVGRACYQAGQDARAAELFEAVLAVDPGHAPSSRFLARTRMRQEDWKAAEALLLRVIELDPRSEDLARLGICLSNLDRSSEAVARFRESLGLKEDEAETHVLLGGALLNAGETDEGIRHLERALELEPSHAKAKAWLARARGRAGRQ